MKLELQAALNAEELKQSGYLKYCNASDRYKKRRMRASFNWSISIIENDEMVNAMCAPGGNMMVFTGLLTSNTVANDEEFAAILSHEISHAIARHGVEKLQTSIFVIACLYALLTMFGIELSSMMDRIFMFLISKVLTLPMSRKGIVYYAQYALCIMQSFFFFYCLFVCLCIWFWFWFWFWF